MTGIAIYDPRRLSERDFLQGFTARHELVGFLLTQLRLSGARGEARHRVIVGQRGMGKTSLLRRLAIGMAQDPELADTLLPLTFREEQYTVRTLAHFWRTCGEALAEWLERSGDAAGAERLDRELAMPAWQEADSAGEAFLEHVSRTGRRPVLLVDNLDLVLDALPDDQHWQLRRTLQDDGGPIVFGAATLAPRQSGDSRAAFYEFFRIDVLEPLSEAELLQCMRHLAAARGEAGRPVAAILDKEPQRLRVLHTLSGGNPRILALIYQLLERAESETVFADLEVLLDQLTPLYKARVEELRTELQRSILDAVALHWDPITSHDIAVATGVEITTVSSQLSRLKNFGLVEEVPTSGARAGYQLTDRFFNVWYLMRHGTRRTRQKMRWLTAFLQTFYTYEDLTRLRERLARDPASGEWPLLYGEALDAAGAGAGAGARTGPSRNGGGFAEEYRGQAPLEPLPEDDARRAPSRRLFGAAGEHAAAWRHAETEAELRETVRLAPKRVRAWIALGNLLADHLRRPEEAESAYLRACEIGGKEVATARRGLIWLYLDAKRGDEARALRRDLSRLEPAGLHLLDAAIELAQDNFGAATRHLDAALRLDPNAPGEPCFDDLLRLLRRFERHGYAERLAAWFEETGHADRHAPTHAAFAAHIRGERMLLDVSPEVRQPAERIYAWLAGHLSPAEDPRAQAAQASGRSSGRPSGRRRGSPPK
ncbi:MAG TPA: AAA family ATPase, partial [Arenibaculum sp.]|nr:AAA family ATPase [Arenibaculum sp.]